MILSQFAGVAERPELRCQGHTRESRLRRHEKGPVDLCSAKQVSRANRGPKAGRWSGKMAQKGDFAGTGSFAIPSLSNDLLPDAILPQNRSFAPR